MNDVIEACEVLRKFCASQSNCSYCPIDETCNRCWEQRNNLEDVMEGFIHDIRAHDLVKNESVEKARDSLKENICSKFANCQECIFAEAEECPFEQLETYIDHEKA